MHESLHDSQRWLISPLSKQSTFWSYYVLLYFVDLELIVIQEETVEYVKTNMWIPVYPTIIYKAD